MAAGELKEETLDGKSCTNSILSYYIIYQRAHYLLAPPFSPGGK